MLKRMSLQWRVTVLTALVLFVCTVLLTYISIANAQNTFVDLMDGAPQATLEPSIGVPTDGVQGEITYAMPTQEAKQRFDSTSILACVLLSLLGSVAVYYLAGRALYPLRRLVQEMDSIDAQNLTSKLPEAFSNDEISMLTNGFNHMLSRLDDAFLRQKRFSASAAHELKTPLAILKTGAQVLAVDEHAGVDDYRANGQTTIDSVDRLTKVVDDLLFLASAAEGTDESTEDILLEPLFEAIRTELEPQLAQRNIACHLDCGDISLQANFLFLYRAFFNLIENACKYGKDGGNIWITACQDAAALTVAIQDDGSGIAREHLPYIFEAFYRVDKSRSRGAGGSGLGLSIVKTMLERCGGSIAVDSDGSNGSCFTIQFARV